jgi:cbb3-type cytochrome oxidase subunit 3
MSLTDVMSAAGLSSWTEFALILCFIAFSATVLWVFVVRRKPTYEHARHLPLEDNETGPPHAVVKGGDTS